MLASIYTCQNATLLEITCRGSYVLLSQAAMAKGLKYSYNISRRNSKRVKILF